MLALYDFDGEGEGILTVKDGEVLDLLDQVSHARARYSPQHAHLLSDTPVFTCTLPIGINITLRLFSPLQE